MTLTPVWRVREPPLHAAAVLATGARVDALSAATAQRLASGADLRATAAPSWLVVLGDSDDLPWTDGARYLGWDDGALAPTTAVCSPGPGFVRRSVGTADELVVVVPDAVLVGPRPRRRASL